MLQDKVHSTRDASLSFLACTQAAEQHSVTLFLCALSAGPGKLPAYLG